MDDRPGCERGGARRIAARALLLLASAALGACGRSEREAPAWIEGPPQWRALSEESRGGEALGFSLKVRAPCRARFRLVPPGGMAEEGPWHELASGQSAHIVWTLEPDAPLGDEDVPQPADERAGRTHGSAVSLRFQFKRALVWHRRFVFWSRPGTGTVLAVDCAPPGAYEDLDWSRPLELAAAVGADYAQGEPRLLPRRPASKLVLPAKRGPGDRHESVRLELVVEPLHAADA